MKYIYLINYEPIIKKLFISPQKYDLFSTNIGSKYNILFFGTDEFSLSSLRLLSKELKKGLINKLEVVTSVNRQKNKVMEFAKEEKLFIHPWPLKLPSAQEFDLGIVVSFGHLIPERVIAQFPLGMLNVHASLLPRWRGAAPVIHTLLNGDEITGVTIMKIKPKHFDIGEVVLQKSVAISQSIMMPELRNSLGEEGATLLIKCLHNLDNNLKNAKPQDSGCETYAPKVSPELAIIRWTEQTAQQVYNLHRALYGLYSLTTSWQGVTIKLFGCSLNACECYLQIEKDFRVQSLTDKDHAPVRPGFVYYNKIDKLLYVKCKDNLYVTFNSVRLLNKKTISASDFNNGFMKKIDQTKHHFL